MLLRLDTYFALRLKPHNIVHILQTGYKVVHRKRIQFPKYRQFVLLLVSDRQRVAIGTLWWYWCRYAGGENVGKYGWRLGLSHMPTLHTLSLETWWPVLIAYHRVVRAPKVLVW